MIGMEPGPLDRVLGTEIGQMMARAHAANGVKLHMASGVKEVTKDAEGKVSGVVLSDGTTLDVDMVIVGAGITPATKFLARTETGV